MLLLAYTVLENMLYSVIHAGGHLSNGSYHSDYIPVSPGP